MEAKRVELESKRVGSTSHARGECNCDDTCLLRHIPSALGETGGGEQRQWRDERRGLAIVSAESLILGGARAAASRVASQNGLLPCVTSWWCLLWVVASGETRRFPRSRRHKTVYPGMWCCRGVSPKWRRSVNSNKRVPQVAESGENSKGKRRASRSSPSAHGEATSQQ